MFEAINEYIIATEVKGENTTASGIVLSDSSSPFIAYKVVHTNELTKNLQDKIIYAESKYKTQQLPDKGALGESYIVIPIAEIVAVKKT